MYAILIITTVLVNDLFNPPPLVIKTRIKDTHYAS